MRRFSLTMFAALALGSASAFAQDCADGKCNLRSRVASGDAPVVAAIAAPLVLVRDVAAAPVQVAATTTRSVVKTVTVRKPVRSVLRGLRSRVCR